MPSTACVNTTAVNSDTSVPTPSVNAKPFTPAVASTNRMNAVISVTTFASMIVAMPRACSRWRSPTALDSPGA